MQGMSPFELFDDGRIENRLPKNGDKYVRSPGKAQKKWKFWVLKIFLLTFLIANVFSWVSNTVVRNLNLGMAAAAILLIIAIGVVFDAVGIAVTAASEVPFVSMASKRIRGASQALQLIKNADQVSNFCNDVVGDICGIISGAAGGILFLRLADLSGTLNQAWMHIIMSSMIASATVGSKAFGKTLAIRSSQRIVHITGIILSYAAKTPSGRKTGKRT